MDMMENYFSDTPIFDEEKDAFQRYGFAKRIAETIIQRKAQESIVIGIYGEWGEGKTSVLNFIEGELIKEQEIVICKFNPWRFTDETHLLIGFFNLLASQLNKSIKNKKEKISQIIADYAEAIVPDFSIMSGVVKVAAGKGVKAISEKIAHVSIEESKKRIEKILLDTKRKVVVFIDDIDRLDKKEIQAVFKLIKLTGDFLNTTYVLAFDEKMVAKAIGEMYEDGGENAGKNFLEKIIQVPLSMPVAQKEALRKFSLEKVDNAITQSKIEFSKEEAQRFVEVFSSNILKGFATPRVGVRYGNSLSFSLPLLYRESNTVDLMLIEAIKIVYPELYSLIRDNPNYFIKSYSSKHEVSYEIVEDRKRRCKEELKAIGEKYHIDEDNLIALMVELFPILNAVYYNYIQGEHDYIKWYEEKRIGSPQYFQRYFSYSVIKGDVSDILFDNFKESLNTSTIDKVVEEIKLIAANNDGLITKLEFNADKFDPMASKSLAVVVAKIGNSFAHSENSLFGFDTQMGRAARVVYKLVNKMPSDEEKLDLTKNVVKQSESFLFAYEFLSWFRNSSEKILSDEQFYQADILLLEKAVFEAGNTAFFMAYPKQAIYLFKSWFINKGRESLMSYLKDLVENNPKVINDIIRSFSPQTQSAGYVGTYFGYFEEESYTLMNKIFDTNYLAQKAMDLLGSNVKIDFISRMRHEQTDENRLKQFLFCHQHQKPALV